MGGGTDGVMHECALGRVRVLARRRLERRGRLDRQSESLECRLRVRLSLLFSFPAQSFWLGGVFASIPLRHPPIMRPTSSICTLNSSKCLFEISFASHAICTKKRSESVIPIARTRRGSLSRGPAYVATRNVSRSSMSRVSIFEPIPNRSSRPMLRRIGNHRRYTVFVCSITGKIRAGGGSAS